MKDLLKYSLISTLLITSVSCTDLDEEIRGDFTKDFTPANLGVGLDDNAGANDGLGDAFSALFAGTATNG